MCCQAMRKSGTKNDEANLNLASSVPAANSTNTGLSVPSSASTPPESQENSNGGAADKNNGESCSFNNSVVYVNRFFKNDEENKEDGQAIKGLRDVSYTGSCNALRRLNLPLYAICTTPNNDNIRINITHSQTLSNTTDSSWISVCRICHGGESMGNLISPCKCRGSIAEAHLQCLERWLKESANSHCELCQHHFEIIRKPKLYGLVESVFVFLRHPGDHLKELLLDLFAFLIYTPVTVGSTYMLMLICDSTSKTATYQTRNSSIHVMTLAAVFGMAAIDFTYSSWLAANFQKHALAWRSWYRSHCDIKLVLPEKNDVVPTNTLIENDFDMLEHEVD